MGKQFPFADGTTDVTRTIHLGKPTDFEREAYTRVLMGSIQLASLVFPVDVPMNSIDVLARSPLWEAGLNYLHGTGHGVGAFLNVHEGEDLFTWVKVFCNSEDLVITLILKLDIIFLIVRHSFLLRCNILKKSKPTIFH